MRISVFVEDAGQEDFVLGLINRTLEHEGLDAEISVRNSVGGSAGVMRSLKGYLRDVSAGVDRFAEIAVVAIDGNCHGHSTRVRTIREIASEAGFAGTLVCAVPDPHIEAWYLADGKAIKQVLATDRQGQLPARKCERDYYKNCLIESFRVAGVRPPLGGAEYGGEVAAALDLVLAARRVDSLGAFLSELRAALRASQATDGPQ